MGAVERGLGAKKGGEGCSSFSSGRTSVEVERIFFFFPEGNEVETGGRFYTSKLGVWVVERRRDKSEQEFSWAAS